MRPDKLQYSPRDLKNLGISYYFDADAVNTRQKEPVNAFYEQFRHILDVVFGSTDGTLDNTLALSLSESAPEDVKSFVNNVFLVNLPVAQSASSDEEAFEMLIPRSAQTSVELAPYIERMSSIVRDSISNRSASAGTETE